MGGAVGSGCEPSRHALRRIWRVSVLCVLRGPAPGPSLGLPSGTDSGDETDLARSTPKPPRPWFPEDPPCPEVAQISRDRPESGLFREIASHGGSTLPHPGGSQRGTHGSKAHSSSAKRGRRTRRRSNGRFHSVLQIQDLGHAGTWRSLRKPWPRRFGSAPGEIPLVAPGRPSSKSVSGDPSVRRVSPL